LASLSAASVRPAAGKFKVVQADQSVAGSLVPGGPPLQVTSGPVSLQYAPPANDPILREFTINLNVADRYELAGSLYLYSAEAYEKDRNAPMAIRAYQRLLEEKQFPTSEEPERARVPEKIRLLYRAWIEAYERQAKPLGGDFGVRIDEVRRKAPGDAIPALMEIWAAKDAPPEARGTAAAALALACAKQSQPFEAVEWAERAVKDKIDIGHDTSGALVAAAKGVPGLGARWDAVAAALEALRVPATVKNDPTPNPQPTGPVPGAKVGIVQLANKYGIYVRLDPNMQFGKGDALEIWRGDAAVGEIVVDKPHPPDKTYPNGSVECQKSQGTVQKGDEVRLKK
ncbi:MAG TPA: hypothetical protein VE981_03340, partial [Planctomycetota bacterium]|nr:hypothetical protein [Planctomycetota bacterium]